MLFRVGKVRISIAVLESSITTADMITAFERYIRGDWGRMDGTDGVCNDLAIVNGERILSTYSSESGLQFCISTLQGVTTITLPEEVPALCDPVPTM